MWLDAKNTRNETRPIRMIHRTAEKMLETEQGKDSDITKDMKNKAVLLDDIVMAFASRSELTFTDAAKSKWRPEQLDAVAAFATLP